MGICTGSFVAAVAVCLEVVVDGDVVGDAGIE